MIKLSDVEKMIIASSHLDDDKLQEAIDKAVADVAWHIRNRKWDIHFAIFKHRALPEEQGHADLAQLMYDVVSVRHPMLQKARSTLRLYLSQETPSKNCMTKMKRLQREHQDEGRDEMELEVKLLATKYRQSV